MHPELSSKVIMVLLTSKNSCIDEMLGFRSSQYPIRMYLSSKGGKVLGITCWMLKGQILPGSSKRDLAVGEYLIFCQTQAVTYSEGGGIIQGFALSEDDILHEPCPFDMRRN